MNLIKPMGGNFTAIASLQPLRPWHGIDGGTAQGFAQGIGQSAGLATEHYDDMMLTFLAQQQQEQLTRVENTNLTQVALKVLLQLSENHSQHHDHNVTQNQQLLRTLNHYITILAHKGASQVQQIQTLQTQLMQAVHQEKHHSTTQATQVTRVDQDTRVDQATQAEQADQATRVDQATQATRATRVIREEALLVEEEGKRHKRMTVLVEALQLELKRNEEVLHQQTMALHSSTQKLTQIHETHTFRREPFVPVIPVASTAQLNGRSIPTTMLQSRMTLASQRTQTHTIEHHKNQLLTVLRQVEESEVENIWRTFHESSHLTLRQQTFLEEHSHLTHSEGVEQLLLQSNHREYTRILQALKQGYTPVPVPIPVPQQATEQVTQHATQQATEQVTQHATQQATEQVTQHATQQVTEQVTQQATEQVTQQVTQQATEQVRERLTQRVTENSSKVEGADVLQTVDITANLFVQGSEEYTKLTQFLSNISEKERTMLLEGFSALPSEAEESVQLIVQEVDSPTLIHRSDLTATTTQQEGLQAANQAQHYNQAQAPEQAQVPNQAQVQEWAHQSTTTLNMNITPPVATTERGDNGTISKEIKLFSQKIETALHAPLEGETGDIVLQLTQRIAQAKDFPQLLQNLRETTVYQNLETQQLVLHRMRHYVTTTDQSHSKATAELLRGLSEGEGKVLLQHLIQSGAVSENAPTTGKALRILRNVLERKDKTGERTKLLTKYLTEQAHSTVNVLDGLAELRERTIEIQKKKAEIAIQIAQQTEAKERERARIQAELTAKLERQLLEQARQKPPIQGEVAQIQMQEKIQIQKNAQMQEKIRIQEQIQMQEGQQFPSSEALKPAELPPVELTQRAPQFSGEGQRQNQQQFQLQAQRQEEIQAQRQTQLKAQQGQHQTQREEAKPPQRDVAQAEASENTLQQMTKMAESKAVQSLLKLLEHTEDIQLLQLESGGKSVSVEQSLTRGMLNGVAKQASLPLEGEEVPLTHLSPSEEVVTVARDVLKRLMTSTNPKVSAVQMTTTNPKASAVQMTSRNQKTAAVQMTTTAHMTISPTVEREKTHSVIVSTTPPIIQTVLARAQRQTIVNNQQKSNATPNTAHIVMPNSAPYTVGNATSNMAPNMVGNATPNTAAKATFNRSAQHMGYDGGKALQYVTSHGIVQGLSSPPPTGKNGRVNARELPTTMELMMAPLPSVAVLQEQHQRMTKGAIHKVTQRAMEMVSLQPRRKEPLDPWQDTPAELQLSPVQSRGQRQQLTQDVVKTSVEKAVQAEVAGKIPPVDYSSARNQAEAIAKQEQNITALQKAVRIQEETLQKIATPTEHPLDPAQVQKLARAVMKEMDAQIRLERQRRGLI